MSDIGAKLAVIDRLHPYLPDEAMYGRMHADLRDLIEAGQWLLAALEEWGGRPLSADEAETFLIELDVRYADHVAWHLNSLRKDIASILANIASD